MVKPRPNPMSIHIDDEDATRAVSRHDFTFNANTVAAAARPEPARHLNAPTAPDLPMHLSHTLQQPFTQFDDQTRSIPTSALPSSNSFEEDLEKTRALNFSDQLLTATQPTYSEDLLTSIEHQISSSLTPAPLPMATPPAYPSPTPASYHSPSPFPSATPQNSPYPHPGPSPYPSPAPNQIQSENPQQSHLKQSDQSAQEAQRPSSALKSALHYPTPSPRFDEVNASPSDARFSSSDDLTQAHLKSHVLQSVLNESRFQVDQDEYAQDDEARLRSAQQRGFHSRKIIIAGAGLGFLILTVTLFITFFGKVGTLSEQLDELKIALPKASAESGINYLIWQNRYAPDLAQADKQPLIAWLGCNATQLGAGRLMSSPHVIPWGSKGLTPDPHPYGEVGGYLFEVSRILEPIFATSTPQHLFLALDQSLQAGQLSDLMTSVQVMSKRSSRPDPAMNLLVCAADISPCPVEKLQVIPLQLTHPDRDLVRAIELKWRGALLDISRVDRQGKEVIKRFKLPELTANPDAFTQTLAAITQNTSALGGIVITPTRTTPLIELSLVISSATPYPVFLAPIEK